MSGSCHRASGPWPNRSSPSPSESASQQPWIDQLTRPAAHEIPDGPGGWQAHGSHPHRVRRFKLSKDPEFVPKLREIIGLYVNSPAHAIVLSTDEKSQFQALDRTQPGLSMKKGQDGTLTHDYKRHGTTTLWTKAIAN